MPNIIHNFKRYLKFLTPDEQLREINRLIKEFNLNHVQILIKKIDVINQLTTLKKELLINYKLHQHYENNR